MSPDLCGRVVALFEDGIVWGEGGLCNLTAVNDPIC